MQWIAGYMPEQDGTSAWRPTGATVAHDMWLSGYDASQVRAYHNGGTSVIYAGHCFATDDELRASLDDVQTGNWQELQLFPGNYVVVVRKDATTMVIPSPVGTSRVYYAKDPEQGFWWSTAASPLAALIGSNVDLGVLLVDMCISGVEPLLGRSPYDKVVSVPPGSFLSLTRTGPRVHTLTSTPSPQLNFIDAAATLKQALMQSIASRVRQGGAVASDLSGGLDSGTLAVIAARYGPVLGLSYADAWMGMVTDDSRYARRLAETIPGLTQKVVVGNRNTLHYACLDHVEALPLIDLPSPDVMMTGYNAAKFACAAAEGAQHYLNGVAGDHLLLTASTALVDQYRAGQRWAAIQHASQRARRARAYPLPIIRSLVRTAHRTYVTDLGMMAAEIRAGTRRPRENLNWTMQMPAVDCLTPDGRRVVGDLLEEIAVTAGQPASLADLHDRQALHRAAVSRSVTSALGQQYGIMLHAPFLDGRVVQACLDLSGFVRSWPGSYKPLLHTAMTGVVPEFLLTRSTKGDFGGTMQQGIRERRDQLARLIRQSQLVDAGLLRPAEILTSLHRIAAGMPASASTISNLVMMEMWLQNRNLRREYWWTQQ